MRLLPGNIELDYTDQEYICPERSIDHPVRIDDLSDLREV